MMEQTSPHQPFSTFLYADPSAYGDVEAYLINQKSGVPIIQTQAYDIFGLGRTIYYDVINNFIQQLFRTKFELSNEVKDLLSKMEPKIKISKKPLSPDELIELGKGLAFRLIFIKTNKENKEEFLMFPPLDDLRDYISDYCSQLRGILTDEEVYTLIQLSELACDMQEVDLECRPTIDQAIERMKDMLKTLQPSVKKAKKSLFQTEEDPLSEPSDLT